MDALARVIAESVGASYGSALLAVLLSFVLIVVVGERSWIDGLMISPTFLLPCVAGIVVAYFVRSRLTPRSAYAWVVPVIAFGAALHEVMVLPGGVIADPQDDLIGVNCQASECVYELFFTIPLVCGVAYSVASLVVRRSHRGA
jgi:peptidoglycan/LPS O-acetylase OafA/YrhL